MAGGEGIGIPWCLHRRRRTAVPLMSAFGEKPPLKVDREESNLGYYFRRQEIQKAFR
jgi:hypothetical protein